MSNERLERAIENVSARTGLLPSVVRHCLTAYADDPILLAQAWEEGFARGLHHYQDSITWPANPYLKEADQ